MNDQRRSGIFLPFWSSCAPRGNLTFKLEKYRSSAPLSMQSLSISQTNYGPNPELFQAFLDWYRNSSPSRRRYYLLTA